MRARELDYMRGNGIKFDANDLFIVDKVENRDSDSLDALSADLRYLKDEFEYVVMDFPGSFSDGDAINSLAKLQFSNNYANYFTKIILLHLHLLRSLIPKLTTKFLGLPSSYKYILNT